MGDVPRKESTLIVGKIKKRTLIDGDDMASSRYNDHVDGFGAMLGKV